MTVKFSQPVSCINGHEYIISYELLDIKLFTENPAILKELDGVFVYDITLAIEEENTEHLEKSINRYSDLITIASYIYVFLQNNPNAILYFFCDDKDVYFNKKRRSHISCQFFRSMLFSSLFHRFCEKIIWINT